MASNAFNNVASISKMAMDCLENNLTFTKFVNRQYDDQFRADGAKNGDSCNIRIPGSYSTRSGSVANPQGYNDTADHIANFFSAVHTRQHVVEDEVFGNTAAIGCHLANHSYFHRNVATWDAAAKTIKG